MKGGDWCPQVSCRLPEAYERRPHLRPDGPVLPSGTSVVEVVEDFLPPPTCVPEQCLCCGEVCVG